MKLTEDDRRLLAALGPEPTDVDGLARALDEPAGDLAARLAELADNGLVDDLGEGRYERTQSGRRLLSTAGGRMDEAVDTTPAIEEVLADADLPADAVDAVRGAYAFLRYWGGATADEIVDAIYPEWPATFDSAEEWWAGVSTALASLPEVAAPEDDREAVAAVWHYTGRPEVTEPGSDGFLPSERRGHQTYGSVRHAIAAQDLSDAARPAVRAAFSVLRRRGTATRSEIVDAVYSDHAAGYDSPEEWWADLVAAVFAELPGLTREDDGEGNDDGNEERWRYDQGPIR